MEIVEKKPQFGVLLFREQIEKQEVLRYLPSVDCMGMAWR